MDERQRIRLWLRVNALLLGVRDPESVSDALLAELVAACGARIPLEAFTPSQQEEGGDNESPDDLPPRLREISDALAARGIAWPVDYEDSDGCSDRAGTDTIRSKSGDARDSRRAN